ncbi:Abi family protein [Granulicatella adiacens]|uniref:Abi family protein n=1 Tax=Granulicatella adiacens TaxID=46124 RepID=UPI003C704D63
MKPFSDINKQLSILKSRNLTISDDNLARNSLMRYGYYEIVNGYKTFLLDSSSDTDQYKDGATFKELIDLYDLDKNIRSAVMLATLEVELSLRTAIAYTLSEDFGVKESEYLNYKNFKQGETFEEHGRVTNERNEMLNILKGFRKRDIEPLNHYRENHNHIPPWILMKETSFGNLKHIFKLLKGPQKKKVISICYGIDIDKVSDEHTALFKDSLALINAFRNRAAHNGRIFNFKPEKYPIRYNAIFHPHNGFSEASYRKGNGKNDLYTLYKTLEMFENFNAQFNLEFYLSYHIGRHCKESPNDLTLLITEMGFPKEIMDTLIDKYYKQYQED